MEDPRPEPPPGYAQRYVRRRQRLSLTLAGLTLLFFLPLPVLGGFTDLLDTVLFGGLTLAWVYALAQFVLAVAVARFYSSRAAALEAEASSFAVVAHEGQGTA